MTCEKSSSSFNQLKLWAFLIAENGWERGSVSRITLFSGSLIKPEKIVRWGVGVWRLEFGLTSSLVPIQQSFNLRFISLSKPVKGLRLRQTCPGNSLVRLYILSDSHAALKALRTCTTIESKLVWNGLSYLTNKVTPMWLPGNHEISDNEAVDWVIRAGSACLDFFFSPSSL